MSCPRNDSFHPSDGRSTRARLRLVAVVLALRELGIAEQSCCPELGMASSDSLAMSTARHISADFLAQRQTDLVDRCL